VLGHCLQKEISRRFQNAADIRIELEETGEAAVIPVARKSLVRVLAFTTVLLAGALAILAFFHFGARPQQEVIRFQESVPPMLLQHGMAVSPDSRKIGFIAQPPGSPSAVYIRDFAAAAPRRLEGTDGASYTPFWSPDSRSIGFVAGGWMKRVDVFGGAPRNICGVSGEFRGGSWNKAGTIIFASGMRPLYSVSSL
jgi:hypothetical protein